MVSYYGVSEAKDSLRIDGDENDEILIRLVSAVPSYITQATGLSNEDQETEPLCAVVADFLIQLWYNGDQVDTVRTQRVIDSLLASIRSNWRTSA